MIQRRSRSTFREPSVKENHGNHDRGQRFEDRALQQMADEVAGADGGRRPAVHDEPLGRVHLEQPHAILETFEDALAAVGEEEALGLFSRIPTGLAFNPLDD